MLMAKRRNDVMLDTRKPRPARFGSILGLSLTGFHQVAYAEWGPMDADVPVLCVHGLTRQGRDFDFLAHSLASVGRRVVCPDLVGRGRSGRLRNPDEYALPQYCADMNALIARTGAEQVDWVGTSLGGLIGIVLAGLPGNRIRRMVINDIGPYLPWSGLSRLGGNVARMPTAFVSFEEAEAFFRDSLKPFGELSDDQWGHLVRHSIAWDEEAEHFTLLCDPGIVRAFRNPWHYSIDLWKYWEAIRVPMLVVRGEESDLLPIHVADRMERLNPLVTVQTFEACGHAPPLFASDQIEPLVTFLCSHE